VRRDACTPIAQVLLTNWSKPKANPIIENTQRDPSGAWKEPSGEWRTVKTSTSFFLFLLDHV